jgi:monofunctional biosynthetic peptidoglycan transglycosylase
MNAAVSRPPRAAAGRHAVAGTLRPVLRWLMWVALAALALQLFFLGRIALMVAVDPQSTAFMRSEAWRMARARWAGEGHWRWSVQWRDYDALGTPIKRAVLAAEDAGFARHGGVDWGAIEQAWKRNTQRMAQAERRAARTGAAPAVRLVGGSTITQQLAKNLLLSGERHLLRKGQELVLTLMLEALLDKRRILEIYLNSVEWGEGIFGAEAAARHYFGKPAARLSTMEAARLAVMLPSPKYFERRPRSAYLSRRASTIAARMGAVELP